MHRVLRWCESVLFEQLEVIVVGHAAVVLDLVVVGNDEHIADLLGRQGANVVLQGPLRAPVCTARARVAQARAGTHTEPADGAARAAGSDQVLENIFGVKPVVENKVMRRSMVAYRHSRERVYSRRSREKKERDRERQRERRKDKIW